LAAAAALISCTPQEASLGMSPAGLEQVRVTLIPRAGPQIQIIAEVAKTPEEQSRGLMNRQSLAPDRGMIFPYNPPQAVGFWMKNTLIPLDMVFIRDDGTIANIAENTVPLSLEMVPSDGPVSAVLELAGGRSAQLGLKAGDKVSWKAPDLP
jgi:uncharacterized membrane protein (UPF0127 family)